APVCDRPRAWLAEPGSARARKPPHREFDAIVGEDAPTLDLGLVGRLGEPAQHLARLLARGLARQGEGIAPEAVPVLALVKDPGGPAGDVDGAAAIDHGSPRPSIECERADDASRRALGYPVRQSPQGGRRCGIAAMHVVTERPCFSAFFAPRRSSSA